MPWVALMQVCLSRISPIIKLSEKLEVRSEESTEYFVWFLVSFLVNVPSSESSDSRDSFVPMLRLSRIRRFWYPLWIKNFIRLRPIKPQPPVINRFVEFIELIEFIGFLGFIELLESIEGLPC